MGSGNTPRENSQTPSDYDEYGDVPDSAETSQQNGERQSPSTGSAGEGVDEEDESGLATPEERR
jgi:hypothetical protein